ncbi:unnamed protein product [Cuscuta campestris]|uniref:DUF4219 domain-containing protein n=1 Tax=Cuscuta campestris TaxID=132261 RepID=A0A484L558_9ASTE|nr:unnamed protein product [Cuscuta campestris]
MGDMEEGANVQRPPLLRGHNYNFWNGRMRAFLKSLGGGVWRSVETGWTEPRKYSDDLTTSRIKPFEEYSRTEVTAAEFNDKALNAIFGAVDCTQYKLISNCDNAKEAWDIVEVTHVGDEEVKTAKYQILMTQYENLRMDEKEKITEFHGRVRDIARSSGFKRDQIQDMKAPLRDFHQKMLTDEDEEHLPQPNLEGSNMEQPDSRSVDAEVKNVTEDDAILHPIATIPETLYLEYTVTNQEENMQSKKKEDLWSEKEKPEIVDKEPLIACSDVPFEGVQFTTLASKIPMAKRTGSRWSLRQKAKEDQESEGFEEIQPREVPKKGLKRKEKAGDDQEESLKKQKTSSPPAKLTTRSQSNRRKDAKPEKSPKPGKFSKHLFVNSIASSFMSEIAKKTILPQRSIDVGDFESKTNLISVLKKCNFLKSITLPGSYKLVVADEEEPAPPLLQVDLRHFEGKHYNDMATREEQETAPAVLQSDFSKTAFIKGEIQLLQAKIEEYKKLIKEAEIKKKKWAIVLSSLDITSDEAAKSQGERTKQDGPDDAATQGEQSEDDEATEEGKESSDAEDDNLANEESDFEAELHKVIHTNNYEPGPYHCNFSARTDDERVIHRFGSGHERKKPPGK